MIASDLRQERGRWINTVDTCPNSVKLSSVKRSGLPCLEQASLDSPLPPCPRPRPRIGAGADQIEPVVLEVHLCARCVNMVAAGEGGGGGHTIF